MTTGGMRPFFNFHIDLDVEQINEPIMIVCAREEDGELTKIGERELKVSNLIPKKD